MARVTVRYWAAARAAAGVTEEKVDAGTLGEALELLRVRHSDEPRFARVLSVCSFVIDSEPVGARAPAGVPLVEGAEVEVLPPFAGG